MTHPWSGWSVRVRTTAAATVVVLVLLTAAGWALLLTLERALVRSQDQASRARAMDVARLVGSGQAPEPLRGIGDDSFVQLVGAGRRVLSASPNVVGQPAVGPGTPRRSGGGVRTVRLRDDRTELESYRVWSAVAGNGRGVVYVGSSAESVSETVTTVLGLLLVGVPLTAVAIGAVTWVVVGRALAPVGAISRQVGAISAEDLSRRVPAPTTGDEVARLAATMNAMLARLDDAARRQREFVADASHDLQAPLTRLRTELEVALADPGADWVATARRLLGDGAEMERLVHDLLFLAREDELSPAPPPATPVDLDDVVLEEVTRLRASAPVALDSSAVSAAPVRGDRDQLARLVRNLLDNAVRHARSRVDTTLSVRDDRVRLVVRDDGPGIPPEQRSHVFERFVRLDDARRPGPESGSGLGLAIVATIARRHGGSVEVLPSAGGAALLVTLPAYDILAGNKAQG